MKNKMINIGDCVTFERDYGNPREQSGTVHGILPDISNGELFAIVELDDMPPGSFETVAIRKLARVKEFA